MALTRASAAVIKTEEIVNNRNRIINGDMRIDQRNAGASVTQTVAAVYTLDRWQMFGDVTSKFSVQQNAGSVTPPAGFTNYLGVTSLSAYTLGTDDRFFVRHKIEGYNISDLAFGTANAKTITVSFWVRSSLTGTFGGSIQNGAGDRSYPFTFTISAATTWEYKTITVAGDTTGTWLTTNGIGLVVNFGLGVQGSTYAGTAGAWNSNNSYSATGATSVVGTNGATFYITGVQLEAGSTATPFERRLYGQELALCQRYCLDIKGGNNLSVLSGGLNFGSFLPYIQFPSEMRVTPSLAATGITGYGSGATEYRVYVFNQSGGGFVNAPATAGVVLDYGGRRGVRLSFNISSAWTTPGTFDSTAAALDVGSSVKLLLTAEL